MDVTGSGDYSMADVQRLNRVIGGLDSGFASFPNVDPILIGDLNGNGQLTTLDSNRFMQFVQGQPRSEIPPLPAGTQPVRFGDALRSVSLDGNLSVTPGTTITVPLVVDGAAGLESLRATIGFDEAALEYRGFRMLETFEYRLVRASGGVITVDLARLSGLPAAASEIVEFDFVVKATATAGTKLIDLQAVVYDDTHFSTAAPNLAGRDDQDAIVTVVLPAPPAPPVLTSAAVNASSLRQAVAPIGLPGNVGTPVNWSEQLSAPATVSAPAPAAVAEWKSAPWAKDLTQRLGQIDAGGEGGSSIRSGLLKALTRLARK
jgi:hypothetical protein